MKISTLRRALLVALAWFCLLVLVAGAATPGYSQAAQAISELAAPGAPYGWLVRFGGFVPLGLIIGLYALAVLRFPESTRPPLFVSALFGLTGLAIIVAGIFPTDPGGQRDSLSGIVHAAAGLTLLAVSSLTPLATLFLSSDRRRSNLFFTTYTILTAIALIGLFLMMPNGVLPGLVELHRKILGEAFSLWYQLHGVVQRTFMVIYFVWLGSYTHFVIAK